MAKRKRLTPARPELFAQETAGAPAPDSPMTTPPSSGSGLTPPLRPTTPPIADMAGAAAAEAAVTEMADALRSAREEGRLVLALPRAEVDISYLVRDRISVDEGDMTTLIESIRARGQQTPIEVVALDDDGSGPRYGLISGWRRLQALERLAKETEEPRFDTVLALLRRPEHSADAYVAMVEENEIRVGLSYYERARVALRAVEQKVFVSEKAALLRLFHAASRAKRSKIRSFVTVVHALDGYLFCPEALPERLGLELARRLDGDAELAPKLRNELSRADPTDPAQEQAVIAAVLRAEAAASTEPEAAVNKAAPDEVAPGVRLKTNRNGSLTLSGPGVDEALKTHLLGWLSGRK